MVLQLVSGHVSGENNEASLVCGNEKLHVGNESTPLRVTRHGSVASAPSIISGNSLDGMRRVVGFGNEI